MTGADFQHWFPIAFPIFFVCIWLTATTLLGALSGWFALQNRYPSTGEPAMLTLRMRSGRMGMVHMNGCLTLSACRSGLRIGVWRIFGLFQKPLLVPWDRISATPQTFFFMPMVRLGFGSPEIGQLTIDRRTWARLLSQPRDGGRQLVVPTPQTRGGSARAYLLQWLAVTAIAGGFFFVTSRLATNGAGGLPPLLCVAFPGTVFGVATALRWLLAR